MGVLLVVLASVLTVKACLDGFRTSVDGGANWNQLPEYPIDTIRTTELGGISNDGKKLFAVFEPSGHSPSWAPVAYSVDGGKTWQQWGSESFEGAISQCRLTALRFLQCQQRGFTD